MKLSATYLLKFVEKHLTEKDDDNPIVRIEDNHIFAKYDSIEVKLTKNNIWIYTKWKGENISFYVMERNLKEEDSVIISVTGEVEFKNESTNT